MMHSHSIFEKKGAKKRRFISLLSLCSLSLVACAGTPKSITMASGQDAALIKKEQDPKKESDPFEAFNRVIFGFNHQLDQFILKPIAQTYDHFVPQPLKKAIHNIFANIDDVYSAGNNILQGKPRQAVESTLRFGINTVLGLGGTIDIASMGGLYKSPEDLGQTLAYWGVGSGPYVVLPIFGPSNVRDFFGRAGQIYVSPTRYLDGGPSIAYTGVNVIEQRASFLAAEESLNRVALDKYTFMRNAYMQKRTYDIYDGNPPDLNDADEFEDDVRLSMPRK